MAAQGIPGFLKYRVLDQNTGAVVIPDLPHLHQSTWNVRAMLPGYPGSASIGDFRIPMAPILSDAGRKARPMTDLLATGQKIEGYLGDVITGTPYVTGVITKAGPRRLNQPWTIEGADTLWWLQQSQILPGEFILAGSMTGLQLLQQFSGTQEGVWDDDFSSGSLVNYTNSLFSTETSDPYFGLPGITSTSSPSRIVSNTTWNRNQQFSASEVSIHGTLVPNSDVNNAGAIGVLLFSDAAANNATLARMFAYQTATVYNVKAEVGNFAGGVFTSQAVSADLFTSLTQPIQFEMTAVVETESGGNQFIRVIVNGKDSGLRVTGSQPVSGGVGVHYGFNAGAGASVHVNNLQFHGRTNDILATAWGTNRFAAGAQSSNRFLPQSLTGGGETHLDLMLMAASLDGFLIRKNPKAGFKADSLDYNVSPGTDYSAAITLEQGVNVIDAEVAPVADLYATDLRLNGIPGGDSGGAVTWRRIAAAGDIVLKDTVSDVGTRPFRILMNWARTMQGRKSSPMQATQAVAVRTADLLALNNGIGPRELDTVMVNLPDLNVNRQKSQIVGLEFLEGSPTMLLWLGGLPEAVFPQATQQRFGRAIEYLTNTFQPR